MYLYYFLHPPPCTATVSVVPTEGRNEASNSAEDAEAMEESADQASSQSAQAKEVSSVEQTAAEPYESEELAYEGESDVEKSAGRVARGEREGTPLQDENGDKGKTNKDDVDNKEPDPVIDLHVSEPMDMEEEIDEDVAPEMEENSAQTQELAEPKKEVEQPSTSTEPHEMLLERFTSRYLADIRPASAALRDMHCVY